VLIVRGDQGVSLDESVELPTQGIDLRHRPRPRFREQRTKFG
jgi:hypothetical protein